MSNDATKFCIRQAEKQDVASVLRLIKELCAYEEKPQSTVTTTEEELTRDGFGEDKFFNCLIAEVPDGDGSVKAVGFALYFKAYSTWQGRVLYLEDLYVEEEHRRKGIGSGFFKKLSEIAISLDCVRLEFCCLDWNKLALDFYKSIGADCHSEWRFHHFTRANMERFIQTRE